MALFQNFFLCFCLLIFFWKASLVMTWHLHQWDPICYLSLELLKHIRVSILKFKICFFTMCCSRKYPYLAMAEIRNSGGVVCEGIKDPGNSRGQGVGQSIQFPDILQLCTSRKYPTPPPCPHGMDWKFQGVGGHWRGDGGLSQ